MRLVSIPAALSLAFAIFVIGGAIFWLFVGTLAVDARATGVIVNPPANTEVTAPQAGVLLQGPALLGKTVASGETLATLQTTDNRVINIPAPYAGLLVSVGTGSGASLAAGDVLLTLAPNTTPQVAYLFVPTQAAAGVARGDRVEVAPTGIDVNSAGLLVGTVEEVVPLPISEQRLNYLVTDDSLAQSLTSGGPVNEVVVSFKPDPRSHTGLAWTSDGPPPGQFIVSGTTASAEIILTEQAPWRVLIGGQ